MIVVIRPGIGVQQFVVAEQKCGAVELVCPRLQVKRHDAAAADAALRVQAAGLRLQLLHRLHGRTT